MPTISAPNPVALFDFDGVIADSLDVFSAAFFQACETLEVDCIADQEAMLRLFDNEANMARALRAAGFPLLKLRRLPHVLRPLLLDAAERTNLVPRMDACFNAISTAMPAYIITSNLTAPVERSIRRHGLRNVRATLGSDVARSKVKKIRRIMRRHRGCAPLYIGDTRGDVIEGRAAGAATIAVAWGWHDVAHLAAAQPDHLVHTPKALQDLLLGN